MTNNTVKKLLLINPLEFRGNYSATSNNYEVGTLAVVGWVVTLWYSQEGTGRGRSPPRPLLVVPNVIAHPSTASVLITALL